MKSLMSFEIDFLSKLCFIDKKLLVELKPMDWAALQYDRCLMERTRLL